MEFQRAADQREWDALLAGKSSDTFQGADRLQRAGDDFVERNPAGRVTPEQAEQLPEVYQERVLPHLVGNIMPVALLRDSPFFGNDNAEYHRLAAQVRDDRYHALSRPPLEVEGLATVHDLVGDGRSWLLMVRSGDMGWEYRNRRSGML